MTIGVKKFKMEVSLVNAAFDPEAGGDPANELATILREVANSIEYQENWTFPDTAKLRDVSGNTVGKWEIT